MSNSLNVDPTLDVDIVDLLTQLLARQVSSLVSETADELARFGVSVQSPSGSDVLAWEVRLYRGLAKNCADKAAMAEGLMPKPK